MRKLFKHFFYIPKYGKVRENVMLARLVMTITVVILCLTAMSFTAYAYFSCNITSGSNIIKAAHFGTKVSIQIIDENGETVDIKPITSNYQTHKVELSAGKFYTVTITPTESSTAKTGFVIVSAAGCNETYHTQQLGVDESVKSGKTSKIQFQLMITDKTDVVFLAHWGTSSYYDAYKNKGDAEQLYITQGKKIKMVVNGVKEPAVDAAPPTIPPTTQSTTPPATQTPPPVQITSPTITPSETTETTQNNTTTETSASTEQTQPLEVTETTSGEFQPMSQPTGPTTTEVNSE